MAKETFILAFLSVFIASACLANFTTSTLSPGGPNVCRSKYRNYCCPGWTIDNDTGLCKKPVCGRHCGPLGRCIKPNVCLCHNGSLAPTCPATSTDARNQTDIAQNQLGKSACLYPCLNGGTCIGVKCSCKTGYTGDYCSEPVCKDACLNGGRCIAPDRCACTYGYAGKTCEVDYRVGPCYTKIINDMCQGQLDGVVCTKQLCCATIGKAWGHPCEHCPYHLDCNEGFLKNLHSGQCVDINECEAIPKLCEGGTCINTLGSFHCTCPEGKRRNAANNACQDEDECKFVEDGRICQHGTCINTDGSYYCICNAGYVPTADNKICLDARLEYCYTSLNGNNECRNPLPVKLSKKDCCCGMNMGKGWGEICNFCPRKNEEEYEILCLMSRGGRNRNDTSLIAVDECSFQPGICGGGKCLDTPSGYDCQCFPGYRKIKKHDAPNCEEIDECLEGMCRGGECRNTPGNFVCTCPVGFDISSDGKQCIDRFECRENGMCANGICINVDGSYKCQCNSGYVISPTGRSCIEVDECYENPRICLHGRCINTGGSYRCECQPGYTATSDDGGFCVDVNECSDINLCENGRCLNTDGFFKCVCDSGFRLSYDKKTCVDLDECANSNACLNGKCINVVGSFTCECPSGFHLSSDGRSCLDIAQDLCYANYQDGQCSLPSSLPVSKSSCCCCSIVNGHTMAWGTPCSSCPLPGTTEFAVLCPHGAGLTFTGDDINECAQNPAICANGACENVIGGYRCICSVGYEQDASGKRCVDVDECDRDYSACNGGQCKNTLGSFQCVCPTGTRYNQEANICEDVNECVEMGTSACLNGRCINTVGSFECECSVGSTLDNTGRVCLDNRKGSCWTKLTGGSCENNLPKLVLKSECCCSLGLAWGSPCEVCQSQDCSCPKGYAKVDGKVCGDINECELGNVCHGGTCINTEGSFTCVCPPGLTLDALGAQCQDTRLETCFGEYKFGVGYGALQGIYLRSTCCCTIGKAWGIPDGRNEQCPRPGTAAYQHLCPKGTGFVDRKEVNECATFPEICANGRCKNTVGSFYCKCNPGFTLDENGFKCVDIQECAITSDICGSKGKCENMPGGFQCHCEVGYENDVVSRACIDKNECSVDNICIGGTCVNTDGSYYCQCPPGLELAADKQTCKDIDECSRTSGICSNGICENLMGTYQCICDSGYQQSDQKSHCEDINECVIENGGCEGKCVNTAGSYSCGCKTGFKLAADGRTCVDIQECRENARICNGGECINTLGSYFCICGDGLTTGAENASCSDVNECEDKNICGNGECVNNVGSYACRCEEGYSSKTAANLGCTDDDECELSTHNCDENAFCINNPGSYNCRCFDGFIGNGFVCHDINECASNNGGCHKNAHCINTDGSFQCVCDDGFHGDGFGCEDTDECVENTNLCEHGRCLNYPGSFRCECEMGFMNPDDKNQQVCEDIAECELFDNLCVFGRCENTVGMFRCECNPGYQVDNTGGNCTDINECDSPQACLYGNCTNTEGNFTCECPKNYQLTDSGNACVDRRESRCYMSFGKRCSQEIGNPVTRAACCCSIGRAWGGRCEPCPLPGTEEFKILCPSGSGFRTNTTNAVMEDINECREHENLCRNGHCTNTFGSYMCVCNEGFRLDNSSAFCRDIDECEENSNNCGIGFCINSEGSYHCICPDGYMTLPDGKECVDMRKESCYLSFSNGSCTEAMSSFQTRMLCCCSMGQAWGKPCKPCPPESTVEYYALCGTKHGQIKNPMTNQIEEIDECALMPQMCSHGHCVNTPGSFKCICEPGYIYDEFAHHCIDDIECIQTPSPCHGNAQCVNTPGSFECQCPAGYKLKPNLKECYDEDECSDRPGICRNGECVNLEGSFQCLCESGYVLTANRDSCVDLDECQRHPNVCNNGTCINTVGSFKCHCFPGFKLSHNNDCVDEDECVLTPNLCRNGRCKNTVGFFKCECTDGYTLTQDGRNCRDIDECREQGGTCPTPGRCQNTLGSFSCICPLGYRLSLNKTLCEDLDECVEGGPGMCEGGACFNTEGSFRCECPEGFVFSGTKCVDMRKELCYDVYEQEMCMSPRNESTMKDCCCSKGAAWGKFCFRCPPINSDEFFKLCPMGMGRGNLGRDLNECELMPGLCAGGECVNTDGSYRCECPVGYIVDDTGKKCVDFDECLTANICGNGTCANVPGTFECICGEGFAPGPTQTCDDLNECLDGSHECAFRCHNTYGSYRCLCPYGYALAADGRHCQDEDECRTPANNCRFQCKNSVGSFTCVCPEGYRQIGNGGDDCRDIDECRRDQDTCKNGRCINTEGGFRCECSQGFQLTPDERQCLDKRLGNCFERMNEGECFDKIGTKFTTQRDCCCSIGLAWGSPCRECPNRGSTDYQRLCSAIAIAINTSGRSRYPEEVDECAIFGDLCKNGKCVNTVGSYRCMCNKGYKTDYTGLKCIDVNECSFPTPPCQMTCENTEGSYSCSCKKGYALNKDNSTCRDVDECALGTHICQHKCFNVPGSYECECHPGYRKVGDHCLDENECESGILCNGGTCINTLGSYRCLCSKGFKSEANGTRCAAVNGITTPEGCPNGNCDACKNGLGPGCLTSCPPGYRKHPYHANECLDENECDLFPCGMHPCVNTLGSYRCLCPDDYRYEESTASCQELLFGNCDPRQCSFGCAPFGLNEYSCGCPSGYQRIAQGHCLSNVNLASGNNIGGEFRMEASTQSIISSEGCFSCKINGNAKGNRRRRMSPNNNGTDSISNVTEISIRHHHGEPRLELIIPIRKASAKQPLIRIQPATKDTLDYKLKEKDAKNFKMTRRNNKWTLRFRKKFSGKNGKQSTGVFSVGITALAKTQRSTILRLKIHVLP